jgi:hypothetical protein
MIKLIVTASDELYRTLSQQARTEGYTPQRARDVLQGFERATRLGKAQADQDPCDAQSKDELSGIVIDMSLRAADTLLETLHVRQSTSGIPLVAVKCDGQAIPLALRRLCDDVLETDRAPSPGEPELGES